MRAFVTGDTHGGADFGKLLPDAFPEGQALTKDDVVIVAGDFGYRDDGDAAQDAAWREMASMPWTTAFVDGNHEWFGWLHGLPVTEWHGGRVQVAKDGVIHLMRGEAYDIAGRTVFTLGGALSWSFGRMPSLWNPGELPSADEMGHAQGTLEGLGCRADVIVTHDCSTRMLRLIHGDTSPNMLNDALDRIEDNVDFGMWYFGHHHIDRRLDARHTCVYDDVIPL